MGALPIPDPRLWPAGVRERFRELAGDCGPLDICIFVAGATSSMFLQDAISAAGLLPVNPSEWHIEDGYPAFHFPSSRAEEYGRRLTACGYAVRVIEMAGSRAEGGGNAARAEVVDIASARRGRRGA